MAAPAFIPGVELADSFYREVVGPRLDAITHSAAFIGPGSDVLGYDDIRSTDHYWGPRLEVFVEDHDVSAAQQALLELPPEHRGWPTVIGSDKVPFAPQVHVWTVHHWLMSRLGVDAEARLDTVDWLVTPQQQLLEVTRGRVFHDGLDRLHDLRATLAWYPEDVWRWQLACQWVRIGQEEAFAGRTAEVGDTLGSRVVTGRLARDVMRLCFLLERTYAPYSKWLGTAFSHLHAAADVGPALVQALDATTYRDRETGLTRAYEAVARRHNALRLSAPQDPSVRPFHERPFLVIGGERFAAATIEAISDPWLRSLPLVGAVDQWTDSTDVVENPSARAALRAWYHHLAGV